MHDCDGDLCTDLPHDSGAAPSDWGNSGPTMDDGGAAPSDWESSGPTMDGGAARDAGVEPDASEKSEDLGPGAVNSAPTCLSVDRTGIRYVPPAGLEVAFRVLDCDGNAVRMLASDDLTVLNDETQVPFNQSTEGGNASPLQSNADIKQYSILVLDLSNSIVSNGRLPDVIAGARAFVRQVVTEVPTPSLRHHVAIVGFGSTSQTELVQGFTQDDAQLETVLDAMSGETGRGTTNLYGAYSLGLAQLSAQGSLDAVVERFMVLLTDGTHEAGDEANLRMQALEEKHRTDATIFTLGVRGDYDACRLEELTGRGGIGSNSCEAGGCQTDDACAEFTSVERVADLEAVFGAVSQRAIGISRSNYRLGVCTPVELGDASLTLAVALTGSDPPVGAEATMAYSTGLLNGDVSTCDAAMAAAIGQGPLACALNAAPEDACELACQGMECGSDKGIACGACDDTAYCSSARQCIEHECGDGIVGPSEVCDDGDQLSNGEGACVADCSSRQVCGDGERQGTESCDDGPGESDGRCLDDCSDLQQCGDGARQGTEACDDGNTTSEGHGHCTADCSAIESCGNGRPEGSEQCDDGEGEGEGLCLDDCSGVQMCGNGAAEGTESCDAGDETAACSATCFAKAIAVTAHSLAACALFASGEVKCWGRIGDLAGDTTLLSAVPMSVDAPAGTVTQLAVGNQHACALMSGGGVQCWGTDQGGVLGYDMANRDLNYYPLSAPVQVAGLESGVLSISAGSNSTCATLGAKSVSCWGATFHSTEAGPSYTPVVVDGFPATVSSVAVGGSHACALLESGAVWCWGYDDSGQLGNDAELKNSHGTPVLVEGLSSGVVSIAADSHTCAVLQTGGVKCWGLGEHYKLGNGLAVNQPTPVDVQNLDDDGNVTQVAAGNYHTCARLETGSVMCWGDSGDARNGNGTKWSSPQGIEGFSTDVASIAAGRGANCALLENGAVMCWGSGSHGQLGNGEFDYSATAVGVVGDH